MLYYMADYFALVLLWVLVPKSVSKFKNAKKGATSYFLALVVNMLFCISNICNGISENFFSDTTVMTKTVINTAYYILACMMIYFYARYILQNVDMYASRKKPIAQFYAICDSMLVVFMGICLLNLKTGIIFVINDNLELVHGLFWIICYVEVAFYGVTLYVSMVVCKSRTAAFFKNIVITILPMVAFIVAFRFIFPQILFEGFAGSMCALILMLRFQNFSYEIDSETQLGNLHSLVDCLDRKSRRNQRLQLILISIRNFSYVNNNYGYDRGNRILFKIAFWLEDYFSHSVQLFRYGSSTFVAVAPMNDGHDSREMIHDLINAFPKRWGKGKQPVVLSAYFVDLITDGQITATQILEELDYAKKKVKYSELSHMHFDELLYGKLQHRKVLIKYLEKAIDEKAFEVWYQPILCVENDCFCSAEALMRIKNYEENGYLNTEEVINIAEETGLIHQINEIVLDKVCQFLVQIKGTQVKNISINLTLSQLRNPDFAQKLKEKCEKYDFDERLIGLEITERMLISEDMTVQSTLSELRKSGYIFLLDDFGTGYSNFMGVIKTPLDKIKIDKSLLMEDKMKNREVIKMLIELFHKNGQTVVVEGVETGEQRDFLVENKADFLQGYFYSRPLSQEDYVEFLRDNY